jgi:hypothetical protein
VEVARLGWYDRSSGCCRHLLVFWDSSRGREPFARLHAREVLSDDGILNGQELRPVVCCGLSGLPDKACQDEESLGRLMPQNGS